MPQRDEKSLAEEILALLDTYGEPVPLRHLRGALGLSKSDTSTLQRVLLSLCKEGRAGRDTSDRYFSASSALKGRVQVTQTPGTAFVTDETTSHEYRLLSADADTLMSGDIITFRILPNGRATIKEIVQRAVERMAGVVVVEGKQTLLNPYRKGIPWIRLNRTSAAAVSEGQGVVVRITSYPGRNTLPEGEVVEVVGDASDAMVERTLVLEAYGLQLHFPPEVEREAQAVSRVVKTSTSRADYRKLLTCTIDGATARDFDDAISIETEQGNFRLYVHIADVSHYVTEGSALDLEAQNRATSVYFPAYCIPMLPEALSNDICSLMPKVNRYAMTCVMDIDRQGNVTGYHITPSIIRSDRRFTYEEVQEILDGNVHDRAFTAALEQMAKLAKILRRKRFTKGSIDFDRPEREVIVDEKGMVLDVRRAERLFAHRLIEEFMLIANVTVARHLDSHGYPGIFRIHEEPDQQRMEEFARIAWNFGYPLKGRSYHSSQLNTILEQSRGKPEEDLISTLMLRSMKRAVYSPESGLHYGLGFTHYCHFTSPIRRYPDLIVHRSLRASLDTTKRARRHKRLEASAPHLAQHSSSQERKAADASTQMELLKSVQFMRTFVGEEFSAIISGVTSWGIFVQLQTCYVEGLVHVSTLDKDYYLYQEETHELVGRRTRQRFFLGMPVTVQLVRADVEKRELDFILVSSGSQPEHADTKKTSRSKAPRARTKKAKSPSAAAAPLPHKRKGENRRTRGGGTQKR
ncbi:ribonuclease R [Desulfurispirillum indicum S5]|uniref:Ribonuclease R n=1 Tax=Desulfurispirillum indicum (strain ATCC BAA-1389 / DSM 22839 / S5) TaxID=653733 RepID=E6W3Z0_DESIS|nr:ribonuclease R [Desulfurispirillum indicum]ADU65858.1 ribonuclease R [Desulfurispirillum indicum S5]